MAMKANGSAKATRNPHAKIKSSKSSLALAVQAPWVLSTTAPATLPVKLVTPAQVVHISEGNASPAPVVAERTADGQSEGDDSVALDSWLEAYTMQQYSMVEMPAPVRKGTAYRSPDMTQIKTVDVNKVMVCWLLPGDKWGDSERADADYPTRTGHLKRSGLSQYHRRKLHLAVDNGPIFKGPNWLPEFSTQKPVKGFESWGRPPTCAQLLAEHWNNLARHSDYDYVEVFIHARKKIVGKSYKDWPLRDDITIINWKQRDASCWGPTLLESTFSGTDSFLVPRHMPVVEDVLEKQEVFEASNDPAEDLSNYGTPIQTGEVETSFTRVDDRSLSHVYNETLSLSRIGKRSRTSEYKLLHDKVSGRGIDLHTESMRYSTWLRTQMVHNSRLLTPEVLNYRLNKQFYPFLYNNRHDQVLVKFDVEIKTKWVSGVKQEYRVYTRIGTFIGVRAFSASPPVLRHAPAPSQKLNDDARYHLWLMAFSNVRQRPNLSEQDPVIESTLRISLDHWRYQAACKRIPEIVYARIEKLAAPNHEPVTFSQEVLLNEVKLLRARRLERDFEYLDLRGIQLGVSLPNPIRKDPVVGDEKIGVIIPADPIITTDQMEHIQPITMQELILDPTWTPKVLAQMSGPSVLGTKVIKQDEPPNGDLSKFGMRFSTNNLNKLLVPLTPTSSRPKEVKVEPLTLSEFGSMLPHREPGRQRGSLLQKVKHLIMTDE